MGRLRRSRLAVTACTLTCVAAGLAAELFASAPGSAVDAERVRLVRSPDGRSWAAPPTTPPATPPTTPTATHTTAQPGTPPTSDGPTSPGTGTGPGTGPGTATDAGGKAGQGGDENPGGPGSGGATTHTPGAPGPDPSGPARCSSPRPAHGYAASFVFPCEGSAVNTFPHISIQVSAYPPKSLGGLTVVQTVLTDKDGPVKGPLMFSFVHGITPETNTLGHGNTWTEDVRIGTPCVHDRGETRLSIYLLTPAGVAEEQGWQGGVKLGRIPPGSTLMDEVTVKRVGSPAPCLEDSPSPGNQPTTSPAPTQPSPTRPAPTEPSPTGPSPTGSPSPTATRPTTPSTTAPPTTAPSPTGP